MIKSIDVQTVSFDVEWTQACRTPLDSGRAVFPRPPDTTPPNAPTATADREPDYPGGQSWTGTP